MIGLTKFFAAAGIAGSLAIAGAQPAAADTDFNDLILPGLAIAGGLLVYQAIEDGNDRDRYDYRDRYRPRYAKTPPRWGWDNDHRGRGHDDDWRRGNGRGHDWGRGRGHGDRDWDRDHDRDGRYGHRDDDNRWDRDNRDHWDRDDHDRRDRGDHDRWDRDGRHGFNHR